VRREQHEVLEATESGDSIVTAAAAAAVLAIASFDCVRSRIMAGSGHECADRDD